MPAARSTSAFLLAPCVVCAGILAPAAGAESPPDAVPVVAIDQEPSHRLVLATEALRVFDVAIEPGAVSLWHLHDKDSVLLCLEGADVPSEEPGKPLRPRPPIATGDIYYRAYATRTFVHRIRNADQRRFRILDIEVLAPPRANAPALEPLDAAWRVLIDNERVRVSRVVLGARSAAPPLRFSGAHLFVAMTEGAYAIETRGQRDERQLKVQRGDLRALDQGGIETVRNLGGSELELVVVEVK